MPRLEGLDGVILSHVVEHVRDPVPALERMGAVLKIGGWLYVEVPDAMRYAECLIAPFQDFNTEHINHFSLLCLENLLKMAGFEVVQGGSKTILSAPQMPYPAIWVLGRKVGPRGESPSVVPDQDLVPALVGYITASGKLLQSLDQRLQSIISRHESLIVWGTGQLTLKLLAETCLGRASIRAFVDTNPVHQGKFLHGVPILSPSGLAGMKDPILAASLINQQSIIDSIGGLGISNRVYTLKEELFS
ncbi:MAG: class I SAM-dependent methyltransferase [Blastochloris sp.]|nr:class I SAM-dependent methyltransferase [Blastochloris sp.]